MASLLLHEELGLGLDYSILG